MVELALLVVHVHYGAGCGSESFPFQIKIDRSLRISFFPNLGVVSWGKYIGNSVRNIYFSVSIYIRTI